MPVFKEGTFGNIGIALPREAPIRLDPDRASDIELAASIPLHAVEELSYVLGQPPLQLITSESAWSLYLNELTLNKSFEGFLANMFATDNEVYFTSVAWDYSGRDPLVYPPKAAEADQYIIRVEEGQTRQFIGNGVALWPAQPVTGSLNLLLLVYENDERISDVGDKLVAIHDAISDSTLHDLVLAISVNPTLATAVVIAEAVNELVGIVGKIMKMNRNDFVDMFEGSYGAERKQAGGVTSYVQDAATIKLDFGVTPRAAGSPSEAEAGVGLG